MKIALIDPVGGHGGMDYYDYGLSTGLSNNGAIVHYFTSFSTKLHMEKNLNTHYTFKNLWQKKGMRKKIQLGLGYFQAFKKAKKENCQLTHFQFFHFGIQNIFALVLAKLFRFKTVTTIHDVNSFRKKEFSFLQKIGYKLSDEIIVHNKMSRKELLEKNKHLKNIHVIPHGNYQLFVPKLPPKTKSDLLELLFFGQIKDVKGLEILLHALKEALKTDPNIRLTIAGKPWANEEYNYPALISKLGIENFVTTKFEYIPNEKVRAYFEKCDVVVLPYKKIYQSGVLLMAMSYGRVVLTSDLPAFKEIINHEETGFLFKNQNVQDLAKVILKIKYSSALDSIRNSANRLLEQQFDWKLIGEKTKKVYGCA